LALLDADFAVIDGRRVDAAFSFDRHFVQLGRAAYWARNDSVGFAL